MRQTIIGIITVLMVSFLAARAEAEPAQFEHTEQGTKIYLDIHNRHFLSVTEVETYVTFYDSTGEICYRELIWIDFEDPLRPGAHREIFVTLDDLSGFNPVRVEVNYNY